MAYLLRYCIDSKFTDMGKPFGKASACLREAASAKAGANLLGKEHLHPKSLPEFTLSKTMLSRKMLDRPPSEALKNRLLMSAHGVSTQHTYAHKGMHSALRTRRNWKGQDGVP